MDARASNEARETSLDDVEGVVKGRDAWTRAEGTAGG